MFSIMLVCPPRIWSLLQIWVIVNFAPFCLGMDKQVPKPIFEKRRGDFRHVAFSPKGQLVAGAESEGNVHLWEATSFKSSGLLRSPKSVESLAFSPDEKTLACVKKRYTDNIVLTDTIVQLWSVAKCRLIHVLTLKENGESVTCVDYSVAFSPDGKALAVASRNETGTAELITIWNLQNLEQVYWQFKIDTQANARSLCFAPGTNLLITASAERVNLRDLKAWDWRKKKLKYDLKGHKGEIYGIACSPDGSMLASGGGGTEQEQGGTRAITELMIWDLRNGKQARSLEAHRTGQRYLAVLTVAFSPDGKYLACGDTSGTVILWNVPAFKKLYTWQAYENNSVEKVGFSVDGRLATLGRDDVVGSKVIRLWDIQRIIKMASKQ